MSFVENQKEIFYEPKEGEDVEDDFEYEESIRRKLTLLQKLKKETSSVLEE